VGYKFSEISVRTTYDEFELIEYSASDKCESDDPTKWYIERNSETQISIWDIFPN